jgi:hypothetical protein
MLGPTRGALPAVARAHQRLRRTLEDAFQQPPDAADNPPQQTGNSTEESTYGADQTT